MSLSGILLSWWFSTYTYSAFIDRSTEQIISENRQNTTSLGEWGFGLLTLIQNTTKQIGGARGMVKTTAENS